MYTFSTLVYSIDSILSYLNTHDEDRHLLLDIHYSFNYKSSPNYEIIAIMQLIQGICFCCMESLSKNLLITFVRTMSIMLYKNLFGLDFIFVDFH
jgi:hypothetical protein